MKQLSSESLSCVCLVVLAPFTEDFFFWSLIGLGALVESQMTINGGFFITDPYAYSSASVTPSRILCHTLSNFAFFFQTALAILGPLRLGHLAHLCKGIAGLFVHWRGGAQGQASAPLLSDIPGTQAAALKVAALEA